jgi:hypothetical protein
VADRPPGQCARRSRLRYRYAKTGTAEEQHTDVIDLEVLRVHPDGQKGVQVHYFTGKQEKPVPEQDPVTGTRSSPSTCRPTSTR